MSVSNKVLLLRLLTTGLLLAAMQVQAAMGVERMQRFFSQTGTLRATFVQTVQGAAFDQPEESRGTLVMHRPGRFRWDYQQPYRQQIVADGKNLWLYDVDLEQVVVKPLDEALGDTPAMLLSGSGNVEERFKVEEQADRGDGLAWVRLTPKQTDTGFTELRLGFDDTTLRQMELVDGFGQQTRLRFSDVELDAEIAPGAFRFVPPPGVDVIGRPVP